MVPLIRIIYLLHSIYSTNLWIYHSSSYQRQVSYLPSHPVVRLNPAKSRKYPKKIHASFHSESTETDARKVFLSDSPRQPLTLWDKTKSSKLEAPWILDCDLYQPLRIQSRLSNFTIQGSMHSPETIHKIRIQLFVGYDY